MLKNTNKYFHKKLHIEFQCAVYLIAFPKTYKHCPYNNILMRRTRESGRTKTKKPRHGVWVSGVAEAGFVIVSKKRLPEQELPTVGRTRESYRTKTKKPRRLV